MRRWATIADDLHDSALEVADQADEHGDKTGALRAIVIALLAIQAQLADVAKAIRERGDER